MNVPVREIDRQRFGRRQRSRLKFSESAPVPHSTETVRAVLVSFPKFIASVPLLTRLRKLSGRALVLRLQGDLVGQSGLGIYGIASDRIQWKGSKRAYIVRLDSKK